MEWEWGYKIVPGKTKRAREEHIKTKLKRCKVAIKTRRAEPK
jgi:hypothetical protein